MKDDKYFAPLTGYRAIAAFMVFFSHFNPFEKGSFLHSFTSGLAIGVPLFFVLSGFLIYTRYIGNEISISFYKKYMVNRVARIYPVYFLVTTLSLFFIYKAEAFSPENLKIYFLNITFLRGYSQEYNMTLVTAGWTLTVEETFYLVAPILFRLAGSSIKKYFVSFLVIFGLGWVISFMSIYLFHGFLWTDHFFMFRTTFFGHSFTFIIGIIVGILNNRIKKTKFNYFTLLGFGGLILTLLIMSQCPAYKWKWHFVNQFISAPFIGAIIWGLIHERTLISKLLSTEAFQVLGKSSYSFYLIHNGMLHVIFNKFIPQSIFIYFIFCIFMSIALWKLYEEPLNLGIRNMSRKVLRL